MEKQPCVYILANGHYGAIYIGVTSDLMGRIYQHRNDIMDGFTKKYAVHHLVRYEMFETMEAAILREKKLKNWHRQWKINLIEGDNPRWIDLATSLGFPVIRSDVPNNGC